MMEVFEDRGFEQDNRICLAMIDQNMMRDSVGESLGLKSKSGEK